MSALLLARKWWGSLLVGGLVLGLAPSAALASEGGLVEALPTGPASVSIIAASGLNVLAEVGSSEQLQRSTDGGVNWSSPNLPLTCTKSDAEWGVIASGVLAITCSSADAGSKQLAWYSLTDDQKVGSTITLPATFEDKTLVGRYALIQTDVDGGFSYSRYAADSTEAVPVTPPSKGSFRGLLTDGTTIWSSSVSVDNGDGTSHDNTVLNAQSASGDVTEIASSDGLETESLVYSSGSGLVAYYGSSDSDRGNLHVWSPTSGDSEAKAKLGDGQWIRSVTDAGVLVSDDSGDGYSWWPYVDGNLGAPVALLLTAQNASFASSQDAAAVATYYVDGSRRIVQVQSNGTLSTLGTIPATEPVPATSLALTPTFLVGGYQASAGSEDSAYWKRSVGSTLGASTSLWTTSRASAVASAGRWAVPSDTQVTLYDNDGQSKQVIGLKQPTVSRLSGPYLLLSGETSSTANASSGGSGDYLWSARTKSLTDAESVRDIFGSLRLESVEDSADSEVTYKIVDQESTFTKTFTVADTQSEEGATQVSGWNFQIWGDWVLYQLGYSTAKTDGTDVVAWNFRKGTKLSLPDYTLSSVGDGAAVVQDNASSAGSFGVWNFGGSNRTVKPLADTTWNSVFSVDGNRLAYTTSTKLVITTIPGIGISRPRVLGTVAPAAFSLSKGGTWSVDLDLTKPVKAGKLKIYKGSVLVRSIYVPATANGSLRAITWDGKDDSGAYVGSGTYSYLLASDAQDGSGGSVAIDGTARSLGTIAVTAPTFIASVPTISGVAQLGQKLTVLPNSWTVSPRLQWLRNGQLITGATGTTYTPTPSDVGSKISVRATATDPLGTSIVKVSSGVQIAKAKFSSAPTPVVSGSAVFGKVLTAGTGNWAPAPSSFRYQWLRDGKVIAAATTVSYALRVDDIGHSIQVRVTASLNGYTDGTSALSVAKKVAAATFAKAPAPVINGTAKVGKKLSVKLGSWSPAPAKVTYQWLRNGKAIKKATGSSYKLVKTDKGKKVAVRIIVAKPGYRSVAKISAAKKIK